MDEWREGGRLGEREGERERERERVHKRDDAGNCKLPVYSDVVGGRMPPPPAHPPPKVQFHSVPRQGTGPKGQLTPMARPPACPILHIFKIVDSVCVVSLVCTLLNMLWACTRV